MLTLNDACLPFARTLKTGFSHDRSKTVGASEIGQCIRKTVYSKLGLAPDEDQPSDTGFTTRGNVMEDAWSAPLLEFWAKANGGKFIHGGQGNQITLKGDKVSLSSTPDGVAINMPRDCLAQYDVPDIGPSCAVAGEIKSIDPRYNKAKLPKVPHVPQTMAQLGLIRRSPSLGVKPDWGFVLYVDASDYFDLRVYPVKYSEAAFKSLVMRADLILKTVDPNHVRPEGKDRGGGDCSECPYARQCLGYKPYVPGEDAKAPTKKEVAVVEKLAKKIADLEKKEDAAKKERLLVEGDLYLTMGTLRRKFVQGGGFKVVSNGTPSPPRNDAQKLIELASKLGATKEQLEACKSATREGTSLTVEAV